MQNPKNKQQNPNHANAFFIKVCTAIQTGIAIFMVFLIRIYQLTLSPLLPGACRHQPSCSRYTQEAIRIHGPVKGLWLGMTRIMRCHPWGTWGYDPVPPKEKESETQGCSDHCGRTLKKHPAWRVSAIEEDR